MVEPREWLILKGGYLYRPDRSGYTRYKFEAGRYTEAEARQEAEIDPSIMEAIHESEWPDDLATKVISEKDQELATLRAKVEELAEVRQQYVDANEARIDAEAALAEARKALAEMQPHIDEIAAAARINDEWGRVVTGQTDAARGLAEIARRAHKGGADHG